MTTLLDRELKRQITIDGADYTVILDPQGMRLVGKGKRRPEVQLRWIDLLNGEAALAVALRASLSEARGTRGATPPQSAAEDSKPASPIPGA